MQTYYLMYKKTTLNDEDYDTIDNDKLYQFYYPNLIIGIVHVFF